MRTLLAVLAFLVVAGAAFGGGFAAGRASAPEVPKLSLPAEAQKLSELVPGMGEHWANPADLPVGPIYLVHDGEVIGIEYMFVAGDLMPDMTVAGQTFEQLTALSVGTKVSHMDIAYMPAGHEGFTVPHYDVHAYFISPEEQAQMVPHEH